jgi:hypothetical protein
MLKRTEPVDEQPDERPVGELVQQLVEDGKAYARAELEVAKAVAASKAKALAWPAGILFAALLVAQAAVTVLAVAVFYILSLVMNVIFAGILAAAIFAVIAGWLGWYAIERVKRDL